MKTKAIICKLIFIAIFFANLENLFSQQKEYIENKARTELQNKGITEEELRAHLAEKGIYLDELKDLTEEEAREMQEEIKIAISEIEAKKANQASAKSTPSAIDDKRTKRAEAEKNNKHEQLSIPDKLGGSNADSTKIAEGEALIIKDSIEIWGQHIFRNKSLALYRQANDGD
jgi:hypothetical protein